MANSVYDKVIGQEHTLVKLRALANSAAHAYLFVGPSGCGKDIAARAFAAVKLQGSEDSTQRTADLAMRGIHVDVHEVEREGAGISMDQARDEIIKLAERSAVEGSTRVIIVHDFQLLADGARASLLKTIEEPDGETVMIMLSDWRRERIFAYLDPWSEEHALGKGYQLSHSLIAIGRGELFGVGLGGSVEKLHWLPEAHTDFLLAVIGEEFGLVGLLVLIALFLWLTRRIMHIGRQAIALDQVFAGLVAQGVGLWFGFQAFINIGVNLGALPTKGLTLPFMSYGGSAILLNMVALAIVLRVDYENRQLMRGARA